ncbi:hypothetical protein NA57DRAFT_43677 [Rhizodiscina lignyota]|uniref:Methyltransferase domain-containing protein n=1 Tax=Rhizodiscina lignyota TaxID=1504668 RepID=A0A9P4IA06_9PEZI|nr:hypothetical protein NA57DRAFT_43677 [Rhizodiscina lignyota]
MGPEIPLPLPADFKSTEVFVESLLHFGTTSTLLKILCGGVHILDFFTRSPDVYETVFPERWRQWFKSRNIMDILDFLLREDLNNVPQNDASIHSSNFSICNQWRGSSPPPQDLVEYVRSVRKHCLSRDFPSEGVEGRTTELEIARHVTIGMKQKKIHEVANFARYIDRLVADIEASQEQYISHLVDFGSGQNYLGRALSTSPYSRSIIAIESREHNIQGARDKDVLAKIADKPKIFRNKKEYRTSSVLTRSEEKRARILDNSSVSVENPYASSDATSLTDDVAADSSCSYDTPSKIHKQGNMTYVEHSIKDGNLIPVLEQVFDAPEARSNTSLLTLSLHSCGNLLHHGLRTILNPEVSAVALVGCCYNLMTERLGLPSFKLPGLQLRSKHPRVEKTSSARDPHGFPMSQRLVDYQSDGMTEPGVRLNITARMMAVQAPANWTMEDSEMFFTRHFYRAVLQRIFMDYGVVAPPETNETGGTQPVIIGSLRKVCYSSFTAYVRGAIEKLTGPNSPSPSFRTIVAEKLRSDILTEEAINEYEKQFALRKHDLAVSWSLMAFSAGVIESMIVVDRWIWLVEQDVVEKAWVEPVFDYKESPRNLVVVGIKKRNFS